MSFDAVVIGGGGHVGLPLAIMLSNRGVNTAIYGICKSAVEGINAGIMPFWEPGAEKLFQESIDARKLIATTDPDSSPLCDPRLKPETSTNSNILAETRFPFSAEAINSGY